MQKKKNTNPDPNPSRQKLQKKPFKSVKELESASHDIRKQVWSRLEYARIFQEMITSPDFSFVQDELENGLTCSYGAKQDLLVHVFSKGSGVKIEINKELVGEVDKSEAFVEALIRSTTDSFSKSYYQMKGLIPFDSQEPTSQEAKPSKKRTQGK